MMDQQCRRRRRRRWRKNNWRLALAKLWNLCNLFFISLIMPYCSSLAFACFVLSLLPSRIHWALYLEYTNICMQIDKNCIQCAHETEEEREKELNGKERCTCHTYAHAKNQVIPKRVLFRFLWVKLNFRSSRCFGSLLLPNFFHSNFVHFFM